MRQTWPWASALFPQPNATLAQQGRASRVCHTTLPSHAQPFPAFPPRRVRAPEVAVGLERPLRSCFPCLIWKRNCSCQLSAFRNKKCCTKEYRFPFFNYSAFRLRGKRDCSDRGGSINTSSFTNTWFRFQKILVGFILPWHLWGKAFIKSCPALS